MESFRSLGITEPIIKAIEEHRFKEPSEIQKKTIPLVIEGKDLIGGSATGSGKTLAFAVGIIQKAEKGKGVQALVLVPTRELCEQVRKSLVKFAHHKPLEIISVYGGVSLDPQFEGLKVADVVVGTPGRIKDHLGRGTLNLSKVKTLVLDEADQMLDMGFIDDVRDIIRHCSKDRQTMLFSATIPPDLEDLSREYMKDPVSISAVKMVDPKKLRQVYYDVKNNMKFSLLVHLLKNEPAGLVMVFCNTRDSVDYVANNLNKNGVEAMAIHGGLTQAKRTMVMTKFNSTKKAYILVCTEIAARGLDIQGVSHVYNFDTPKDSKQYIHRIGRTARAGNDGIAINLIADRDHENFYRVMRDYDVHIEKAEMPEFPQVAYSRDMGRDNRGGGRDNFRHGRSDGRGHASGDHRRNFSRGGSSGAGRRDERSSRHGNRSSGSSNRTSERPGGRCGGF